MEKGHSFEDDSLLDRDIIWFERGMKEAICFEEGKSGLGLKKLLG